MTLPNSAQAVRSAREKLLPTRNQRSCKVASRRASPARRRPSDWHADAASIDAELAAVVGVGAETFATLRAHSWLQSGGDERFAMHPLQQDHLRRQPGAEALRAEVVAAMAAHLDAAMPAVAPFGDLPLPAEGAAAALPTLGAAERLVRSAAGSVAVLAECAAHLCTAAPLAQLVPWIERAVALLGHADRQGEAAVLLTRALQRSDLPPWQRAGWALRRSEYFSADGATHAAVAACRDAPADFGLGDAGFHRASWATLPSAVARIVAQRDWPLRGGPRAPFEALLLRSLVWQGVRLSFSPDPWPGASLGLLANTLSARTRGDPAVRPISTSFGLQAFGRPRLATAAWRRGMASGGAPLDVRAAASNSTPGAACSRWPSGTGPDWRAASTRWPVSMPCCTTAARKWSSARWPPNSRSTKAG